jgi:7tm Chemosensory receptor
MILEYCLRSVLFVNRVTGLLPLSFNSRERRFKTSWFGYVYCVCASVLFGIFVPKYFLVSRGTNHTITTQLVIQFGNLIVEYVTVMLAFWNCLRQSATICQIMNMGLQLAQDTDELFKYSGRLVTYKLLFQSTILIYSILNRTNNSLDQVFFGAMLLLLFLLINTNYYVFVVLVHHLVASLKVKQVRHVPNYRVRVGNLYAELELSERLDEISKSYEHVVVLLDMMNRLFGKQLLMIVGSIFYNQVALVRDFE